MLQTMRSWAKYIWIFVIAAPFIFGFLFYQTSGLGSAASVTPSTPVAKVDGQEILYADVHAAGAESGAVGAAVLRPLADAGRDAADRELRVRPDGDADPARSGVQAARDFRHGRRDPRVREVRAALMDPAEPRPADGRQVRHGQVPAPPRESGGAPERASGAVRAVLPDRDPEAEAVRAGHGRRVRLRRRPVARLAGLRTTARR